MLLNAHTALSTSKVLLVPYSSWHVPRYHEWMQDEEIQEATASEPLTLEEEYAMQRSWREDADKLTFIVCRPANNCTTLQHQHSTSHKHDGYDKDGTGCPPPPPAQVHQLYLNHTTHDSPKTMLGDINLFLRIDDGDDGGSQPQIIGEIELMIAEKVNQRQGFGRASLLTFLRYIAAHQTETLREFLTSAVVDTNTIGKLKRKTSTTAVADVFEEGEEAKEEEKREGLSFSALSVKINQSNTRSLALFESLSFAKVSAEPNIFGEFELRRVDLCVGALDTAMKVAGVEGFLEVGYHRTELN